MANVSLPPMITIGFIPRLVSVVEEHWRQWIGKPEVTEICSMSTCMRKPPDGWIERWLHNDLGLYDSESTAWSVCPHASDYEMFAYAVVQLLEGRRNAAAALRYKERSRAR